MPDTDVYNLIIEHKSSLNSVFLDIFQVSSLQPGDVSQISSTLEVDAERKVLNYSEYFLPLRTSRLRLLKSGLGLNILMYRKPCTKIQLATCELLELQVLKHRNI